MEVTLYSRPTLIKIQQTVERTIHAFPEEGGLGVVEGGLGEEVVKGKKYCTEKQRGCLSLWTAFLIDIFLVKMSKVVRALDNSFRRGATSKIDAKLFVFVVLDLFLFEVSRKFFIFS